MAARRTNTPKTGKAGLHPRNPHRGRYDLTALCRSCPELESFLRPSPRGDRTIDFADPAAVRMLNRALLAHHYQVSFWDIPATYLCPPIPGRADYIHHVADLLARSQADGLPPRGRQVRVLDIGTGANCIYPILGQRSYGWRFVATDIDPVSVAVARQIVAANPPLKGQIELRQQPEPERIFSGIIRPGETFDLSLCNPPFHASAKEAAAGTRRKWQNLGRSGRRPGKGDAGALNFGGQQAELWCAGGEKAFVQRMMAESVAFAGQVCWFTTLVSKAEHLAPLKATLAALKVADVAVLPMAQGQKQSRLLAWSFLDQAGRRDWAERHQGQH